MMLEVRDFFGKLFVSHPLFLLLFKPVRTQIGQTLENC